MADDAQSPAPESQDDAAQQPSEPANASAAPTDQAPEPAPVEVTGGPSEVTPTDEVFPDLPLVAPDTSEFADAPPPADFEPATNTSAYGRPLYDHVGDGPVDPSFWVEQDTPDGETRYWFTLDEPGEPAKGESDDWSLHVE